MKTLIVEDSATLCSIYEEAIQRGADDFLGKPFDAARLRVTMINAARKSELTRRIESFGTNDNDRTSGAGESTAVQSDVQDDVQAPIRPLWIVEREAIEAAIRYCDGDPERAAQMLEISTSVIERRKQTWAAMDKIDS